MKTLLMIAAAILALLGCPNMRAETVTDKKVFQPSPTLTLQSLIEAEYGNKVKVNCPRAVHRNLKALTYTPMGFVLEVNMRRNMVKVKEAYPARTVDELDRKIAARTGGKKKGNREVVQTDAPKTSESTASPKALPSDSTTPKLQVPTLPPSDMAKEAATFVDHAGISQPFDLKTVQERMKSAAEDIRGLKQNQQSVAVVSKQRDEATASNAKLAAQISTLTRERDEVQTNLEAEKKNVVAERAAAAEYKRTRDDVVTQLAKATAEKDKALGDQKRSYESTRGMMLFGGIFAMAMISWISVVVGRRSGRLEEQRNHRQDHREMSPDQLMSASARGVDGKVNNPTPPHPNAWPNGTIPAPRPETSGNPVRPDPSGASPFIPTAPPPSPFSRPPRVKAEVTVHPLPASSPAPPHTADVPSFPVVPEEAPIAPAISVSGSSEDGVAASQPPSSS